MKHGSSNVSGLDVDIKAGVSGVLEITVTAVYDVTLRTGNAVRCGMSEPVPAIDDSTWSRPTLPVFLGVIQKSVGGSRK